MKKIGALLLFVGLLIHGMAYAETDFKIQNQELIIKAKTSAAQSDKLITEMSNILTAEGYKYQISKQSKYDVRFTLDKQTPLDKITLAILSHNSGNSLLALLLTDGSLPKGPIDVQIRIQPLFFPDSPSAKNESEPKNRFRRSPVIISREDIDTFNNTDTIYTEARMIPTFKNGQQNGIRFKNIKPDGIWGKLQLRDKDILQKINGTTVSTKNLDALCKTLLNKKTFSFTIIRDDVRGIQDYKVR